jgi:O-antigen/teichoic acid export membrane protein
VADETRVGGRFLRNALGVYGAQNLMTLIGVGTGVITARMLGPAGRGQFGLLMMFPTVITTFVKLGIPQANVYCICRKGATPSDVASNSFWLALALGGALAAACWVGRGWILATALRGAPEVAFLPVLLLFPIVLMQAFFLGILQAQERWPEYNFQQIAPAALSLVGQAIALLWLGTGLLGAVLVQTGVMLVVNVWLVLRVHRGAPLRLAWNAPLAREMLGFGSKSGVQTIAASLHRQSDQYLMNYLVGAEWVGLYQVAVNLTNFILRIPDSVGNVLYPRLAGLPEREAHSMTSRVCRMTLFITVAVAAGYAVFGGFAIRILYGRAFEGSIVPMQLILPGVVMMSLYLILTRNFTSRNRQGVNITAAATALVLNVVFNCLMIPRWFAAGAAAASGISYSIAALILLVMFLRESGRTFAETVVVRRTELESIARSGFGLRRAAAE